MEAIIDAATRGVFMPGDRLVEAEIARDLKISRVPVREALRLLESRGIVVNTPYKGMRFLQLNNARLHAMLKVRKAITLAAAREALMKWPDLSHETRFRRIVGQMRMRGPGSYHYRLCLLDIMFTKELVRLSGNPVLVDVWRALAQQMQVIHAMTWSAWEPEDMIMCMEAILAALESADLQALDLAYDRYAALLSSCNIDEILARRRDEKGSI